MLKETTEELNLIQNTLDKNPQAEEIFYTKYRKLVKNYIKHKYPKSILDIDDYVSDILIQVFNNLSKYNPEKSSLSSWILTITKNYMIDVWRCGTLTYQSSANILNTNNTSFDSVFTVTSASDCTISNTFDCEASPIMNGVATFAPSTYTLSCSNTSFENSNSVCYISKQLSSSDYTLLDMKYIQGYDYCEIGKEFNLTSSTVSNKVNYIKTKLKNCKVFIDE